jgi:3-phytase/alkaline phosphatase D
VVSDNNFSATQSTQVIALALDLERIPAALPTVETPYTIDDEEGTTPLIGDSDDPSVWIDPNNANNSLVIATLKDGGLAVFNLDGSLRQAITPQTMLGASAEYGDIRYNNVDVIYGFRLGDQTLDIAVASDRENDTLAIFKIDPTTRQLANITSAQLSADAFSIFGVDDGEATAYGLAGYKSLISGKSYAFVTQASGNQLAQLELKADGTGRITAEVVRTLTLPLEAGEDSNDFDPADYQSEAMVVDQQLGIVYVGVEDKLGIVKFAAEPDGGDSISIVRPTGSPELKPDLEGLGIYYGPNGSGYLVASSQGDSSYAVYDRQGNNPYLGSFIVGDNLVLGIDQANETDGLDIINVPLGSQFPFGALLVHDGANEPQNAVENDDELENNATNFKFVPWENVANAFATPLIVDTQGYDPRNPASPPFAFPNGVASGDVDQDSAVLWTRATILGPLKLEYSTQANFRTVAGTVNLTVSDGNLPLKTEVTGLTAGTRYFYRFTDAAGTTAQGQFNTAAASGIQAGLRFGVSGDWRGELAPYPAIANADQRGLTFFVELGDTIYADYASPALKNADGTEKEQAQTLGDYRIKHSEVYGSRWGSNTWGDLRAVTAVFATIDDHEVVNDFQGGVDLANLSAAEQALFGASTGLVNDAPLYDNGLQAFQEYNPLRDEFYGATGDARTAGERKLYRANTYGSDAINIVLDARSFRDQGLPSVANPNDPTQVTNFLVQSFDPSRTFLGRVQVEDLKQDLLQAEQAGVTWKFVNLPEPVQNLGVFAASDRYEGYAAERTEILKFIDDNDIDNVVFIAADIHGTVVNNLTYQLGPGQTQIATNIFEITTGSVAFDAPFGPTVAELGAAVGLLTPQQLAFYNSLPVNNDGDSLVNDKDDFIKSLVNSGLTPLGYDPVGLNNNLPQANGLINATLLQGDYVATHSYGWTEFDIDPVTQKLTVTTYGIDAYTRAQLEANPEAITSRQPRIVSQFEVLPQPVQPEPQLVVGTPGDDDLTALNGATFDGRNNQVFTGAGNDTVDLLFNAGAFGAGNNRINLGRGADTIFINQHERAFGSDGDDTFEASEGRGGNRISGGAGNDTFLLGRDDRALGGSGNDEFYVGTGADNLLSGGAGADQFWLVNGELPEGANTVLDFQAGVDVIGFSGSAALGISPTSLALVQVGANTAIRLGTQTLGILNGIEAASLDLANTSQFVFA